MKKKILIVFLMFALMPVCAYSEDKDEFDTGFDAFGSRRDMKPVSEQEVQQAIKTLQENKDKKMKVKKKKNKKSKKMKGGILSDQIQPGDNTSESMLKLPYFSVQVPQDLAIENILIPLGFYNVDFDHKNEAILLKHGYSIRGVIPMRKTSKEPENEDLFYMKTNRIHNGLQFFYGEVNNHYEGFCKFAN
jgi:hypothetical protein